jgi:predicted glycogen debranching enzyme
MSSSAPGGLDAEALISREWIVTNALGGYASGSIAGVVTRRYHGLLVAALPAPLGRVVMLTHLHEEIDVGSGHEPIELTGEEHVGDPLDLRMAGHLREFELARGVPTWRFEAGDIALERRLVMPHRQNTVHLTYRLPRGIGSVRLTLRPSLHFRPHEGRVDAPLGGPYVLTATGDRFEIAAPPFPPLRLRLSGAPGAFTVNGRSIDHVLYRMEQSRGYEAEGSLWSPGHFTIELSPDDTVTLVASTESWETIDVLPPEQACEAEHRRQERLLAQANPAAREGMGGQLVLAADQFVVTPAGRAEEAARAHAAGDEVRTVIAGYHWFTDWGRDTMISLEGLTITTGRWAEAGYTLRTFAHYMRNGLIPNLFPEGEREGLYHTADATLWFFHALARYVEVTRDRDTLKLLLPRLCDSIEHHLRGTDFGIHVDEVDGLLVQGQHGYQLTWMDAKVDGWVVTPRRGKAVEINALWYNALRLAEGWVRGVEGDAAARRYQDCAERAAASFNRRFWYEAGGYLYDVVDGEEGDDTRCRPNQIFAISLDHPVLDRVRWPAVVAVVEERLLTPVGLRSLAPAERDYKPQYYGDLRARDAAYHQGTVWAWLIGPFVDAWLKVHPADRAEARRFLDGFHEAMERAGVGTIGEIFDAEPPFTPRGCIAQAWSVAEVLRAWAKTSHAQ